MIQCFPTCFNLITRCLQHYLCNFCSDTTVDPQKSLSGCQRKDTGGKRLRRNCPAKGVWACCLLGEGKVGITNPKQVWDGGWREEGRQRRWRCSGGESCWWLHPGRWQSSVTSCQRGGWRYENLSQGASAIARDQESGGLLLDQACSLLRGYSVVNSFPSLRHDFLQL